MPSIDLLTIGDCSIDLTMRIASGGAVETSNARGTHEICFYHGSKVPVDEFKTSIAGNAVNIAVGCSKLGHTTSIYTEVGDDENGRRITHELKEMGVDTSNIKEAKGSPTNVHTVIVYGTDRTIFSYHEKRNYEIGSWPQSKWLYYTSLGHNFENFQKEVVRYIKQQKSERALGVAYNPGTIQLIKGIDSMRDMLEVTDILFVNKEEAIRITQSPTNNLQTLHKNLRELGPKLTVITDALNGASAHDGTNFIQEVVYSDNRETVDKTGAGDAFASGFLSAIIYGKKMQEALKWGVINAGSCVKEVGAIHGILSKQVLENILKGNGK